MGPFFAGVAGAHDPEASVSPRRYQSAIARALATTKTLGRAVESRVPALALAARRMSGRVPSQVAGEEHGTIHDVRERLSVARDAARLSRACTDDLDAAVASLEAATHEAAGDPARS